jgi:hypothetical protein
MLNALVKSSASKKGIWLAARPKNLELLGLERNTAQQIYLKKCITVLRIHCYDVAGDKLISLNSGP